MNEELIKTALPDKLSELIRVAQADLRACEADPLYRIDMDRWHEPIEDGTCMVCLAGSVMARTLGVDASEEADPWSIPGEHPDKLDALDCVRIGQIHRALGCLGVEKGWPKQFAPPYEALPKPFHAYLTRIADELEVAGL